MTTIREAINTRFDVMGLLTESTAGVVYVARHRESRETVCLQFVGWRHSSSAQRQRFTYEAREAAKILHPNILPVREVLDGEDGLLVVYHYEPCQTLANVLANGALSPGQAASYALQIADALELCHNEGIVHGGIDPTCVLITETGLVKLIGFGSARLRAMEDNWRFHSGEASAGELAALERTRRRRAGYQAPEIHDGIAPDSRAEAFSLGCVLYEMLSGKRAFSKRTSHLTIKLVREHPPRPIAEVASGVPSDLARVLRRCLRKPPDRRYQHMLDLKIDLQEFREDLEFAEIVRDVEPSGKPRKWWLFPLLAAVAASVYFGVPRILFRFIAPAAPPPPAVRQITQGDLLSTHPAITANGERLAFASNRDGAGLDVYVRDLAGQRLKRVTNDPADDHEPSLSPDCNTVVFRSERLAGGLYVAPVDGSAPPRWIANQGRRPRYSPNGEWIAFWARTLRADDVGGIYVIPSNGGTPRQLAAGFHTALFPVWSVDSRHLLFLGSKRKGNWLDFWVVPLEGGEPRNIGAYRVVRRWFIRAMIPDAWINDTLYFTATSNEHTGLWRIPLPVATQEVAGDSLPMDAEASHDAHAAVASSGHIYFSRLRDTVNLWTAPLDAARGRVTGELTRLFASRGSTVRPSLSRDARWIAYTSDRAGTQNVWLRNLESGQEEQVTQNEYSFFTPTGVVTPDGEWLAFTRYEKGKTVTYLRATGGGPETVLCDSCETPRDWSHDGRYLLYSRSARNYSIGMVERGTGARTTLVQSDRFPLLSPRFSPDSRWIAFHALESPDLRKVFALAISGTASAKEREWVPVTSGQILDRGAQWSPDGTLLYFMSERDGRRSIYAQQVDARTKQPVGQPVLVHGSQAAQRSLLNVPRGLAEMVVLPGRIVFTMGEVTGNIFEASPAIDAVAADDDGP